MKKARSCGIFKYRWIKFWCTIHQTSQNTIQLSWVRLVQGQLSTRMPRPTCRGAGWCPHVSASATSGLGLHPQSGFPCWPHGCLPHWLIDGFFSLTEAAAVPSITSLPQKAAGDSSAQLSSAAWAFLPQFFSSWECDGCIYSISFPPFSSSHQCTPFVVKISSCTCADPPSETHLICEHDRYVGGGDDNWRLPGSCPHVQMTVWS